MPWTTVQPTVDPRCLGPNSFGTPTILRPFGIWIDSPGRLAWLGPLFRTTAVMVTLLPRGDVAADAVSDA